MSLQYLTGWNRNTHFANDLSNSDRFRDRPFIRPHVGLAVDQTSRARSNSAVQRASLVCDAACAARS